VAGQIYEDRGQCDKEERIGRQITVAFPDNPDGYAVLADGLAGQGRPVSSIRVVLEQRWTRLPKEYRSQFEQLETSWLHLLAGDFTKAEQAIKKLAAVEADSPRLESHAWPARMLVETYLETDRIDQAAKVAKEFLDRRFGWESDPRAEDFSIAADVVPTMWRALRRAGKLSPAQLRTERKRWLERWKKKGVSRFNERYLWLAGYAAIVDTAEQAKEALAALPNYEPIPPFRPRTIGAAGVGRTYLLAGQPKAAVRWLRLATRSCKALNFPIEHTRAHDWLGRALEQQDDKPGACQAYGKVIERWDRKGSPSVTLKHARRRHRALACDKP